MKLENQVVSLELSKELKKVGYPQGGIWWWIGFKSGYYLQHKVSKNAFVLEEHHIVAPTVAELGERLPTKYYTTVRYDKDWSGLKSGNPNSCEFFEEICRANTEANARAKMWLYLKKEGAL